ncbi:MAG: hypothetical protein CVU63_07455 [Deltaproteobacteria bacterium HGW-Deltaproteobacteria-20]|nr:MAG: hypothetical protein CVU63_07455 [Deltaproteobacteria bacterium HGW-Deltaproteobacteria-20]
MHVNGLVRQLIRQLIDLQPPQGIFDETVVANLRPALSAGALRVAVSKAEPEPEPETTEGAESTEGDGVGAEVGRDVTRSPRPSPSPRPIRLG